MSGPRVLVTFADWGGSGHYRLIFPANVLIEQGHDITLDYFGRSIYAEADSDMNVTHVRELDYDVVVLARPMTRSSVQAMRILQERGIAVVVELDDDYWSIRADNVFRDGVSPSKNRTHNWQWLTECCKQADLVTVSTPALRDKIPNKNVRLLRNCVPSKYFDIQNVEGKAHEETVGRLIVGWSGSLETHGGDLNACGTSIATAVRNANARFMCVGSEEPVYALGFQPEEALYIPWVDFEQYPLAVDVFDVGLVPLKLYEFNECKCVDLDMRIFTSSGTIKASEVKVGQKIWTVDGWKRVEETKRQPLSSGVEIRTRRGRLLRITEDHRMMVNNEWTTAAKMRVGDFLQTVPGGSNESRNYQYANWPSDARISRDDKAHGVAFLTATDGPKVKINEKWGRYLGVFQGDGSVGQGTNVSISCDGVDPDFIELLMNDLESFGLRANTQHKRQWEGKLLRRRSVNAPSAHFVRFLHGIGVVKWDFENVGNGHQERVFAIPQIIWSSPLSVQTAYLSGLFEADGTCGTSVSMTTKSGEFARDIQLLLATIGIDASIRERWNTATTGGALHRSFFIGLLRHGTDIFSRECGFLSERKKAHLAAVVSRPHSNAYTEPKWTDEIVAIEPINIETVDLQVEGSEYVLEGFRSHNSYLKGLEYAALGVPFIASPTSEYLRLARMGAGVIAKEKHDWLSKLKLLLHNPLYRRDMAEAGLEVAKTQTYEEHAHLWAEAWNDAREIRRAA